MMDDQPARSARPGATTWKSSARVEASRRNGARSRGPKTEDGKQRSAQNALKHGMRAQRFVLLDDEDASEFEALEAALREQLAPEDPLQDILVARIVLAVWRMFRTDRMEVELLNPHLGLDVCGRLGGLGLALTRDGHGPRAFDTLSRYRGAVQAEFWRALRGLSALKAADAAAAPLLLDEALLAIAAPSAPTAPAPLAVAPKAGGSQGPGRSWRRPEPSGENPNEPKNRSHAEKGSSERTGRPYGILAKIGG